MTAGQDDKDKQDRRLRPRWQDRQAYAYHCRTKHTLQSLTASRFSLDWANQPNPFRLYEGAGEVRLPVAFVGSRLGFFDLVGPVPAVEPRQPDLQAISDLLYFSLSVSAWKEVPGSRWALRVNPSSGNLHPTEAHIVVNSGAAGLAPGIYHYRPRDHILEQRLGADGAGHLWRCLRGNEAPPPLVVCLTSIFWREAWKYRERSFRYCNLDAGHAVAAVSLAAAINGWQARVLFEFPDADLESCLGIAGGDESPLAVVACLAGAAPQGAACPLAPGQEGAGPFAGTANTLSPEILVYEPVETVYRATRLSAMSWRERLAGRLPATAPLPPPDCRPGSPLPLTPGLESGSLTAQEAIRRRRSAVDMDGLTRMSFNSLSAILAAAGHGIDSDIMPGLVHLYIYAHRVDGLEPGIYYCDRAAAALHQLVSADERAAIKFASCFQDIAADGCFAVSMVADLQAALDTYGDRGYRYVHFQAGAIGQWLYLAAGTLGYQATGIGCFIDDMVNELLGLAPGHEVVYNFTVGGAVDDPRITTRPAYPFPDPFV